MSQALLIIKSLSLIWYRFGSDSGKIIFISYFNKNNSNQTYLLVINMSLMNRAYRNVFRKPARTLVVALVLGFIIAAVLSVYTGIEASTANTQIMIEEYKDTFQDITELTETEERLITISVGRGLGGGMGGGGIGGFTPGSQSTIDIGMIDNISGVQNVEDVVPLINQRVGEIDSEERELMMELRGQGGGDFKADMFNDFFDYFIQGVPLDPVLDEKYSLLPSNIISGEKISEGDIGKVLIREELTDSDGFFAGKSVGSYIEIEGQYFQIAGLYNSDDNRNNVYMCINDACNILDMDEGSAQSLNVYADSQTAVDLVVYDIQQIYPDFTVMSSAERSSLFADRIKTEQEKTISGMTEDNVKIENTGNQIIFVLIIIAVLIVLFLMLYTVKERINEIGVLKALGFPGKNIMSQFIIEGIIIGFIGGIIGVLIGLIGGPFISEFLLPENEVFATSIPSMALIVIILFSTAILGAIGTIYPAWEASQKHPVEAIRHE
jgi:putative ABC transport system permease protein